MLIWDMAPCRLSNGYQCFGRICCAHIQSRRNIRRSDTSSQQRRRNCYVISVTCPQGMRFPLILLPLVNVCSNPLSPAASTRSNRPQTSQSGKHATSMPRDWVQQKQQYTLYCGAWTHETLHRVPLFSRILPV